MAVGTAPFLMPFTADDSSWIESLRFSPGAARLPRPSAPLLLLLLAVMVVSPAPLLRSPTLLLPPATTRTGSMTMPPVLLLLLVLLAPTGTGALWSRVTTLPGSAKATKSGDGAATVVVVLAAAVVMIKMKRQQPLWQE